MATKKDRILNLVVDSRYKDILKKHAEKKGVSVSQIIREYVDKQLVADPDTTKIILSIPKEVTESVEKLESWLNLKTKALVQHFKSSSL